MRRKPGRPPKTVREQLQIVPAMILYHALSEEIGISREGLMRWVIEQLGADPRRLMTPKAFQTTQGQSRYAKKVHAFKSLDVVRRPRGRPRKIKEPVLERPMAGDDEAFARELDEALARADV
jgi:hypothetical protein